jgi:hypothetical protein
VNHFSVAEVRFRLARIARVEIVRLDSLSKLFAAGLGHDASGGLLGEAISRVLDGRRAWPRGLTTVPFLGGVMRSIANELRKKRSRDPLHHIGAQIDDEAVLPKNEGHERTVAVHRLIEKIRAELSSEPILLGLFELRLNDRSPAEIQSALGLHASAFRPSRCVQPLRE